MNKNLYVVAVPLILAPVMMKKSIAELEIQTKILFVGVITLLVVLFIKQFTISEDDSLRIANSIAD